MANAAYVDSKSNKLIVAIDQKTLKSDSKDGTVVISEKQQIATSEAEFLRTKLKETQAEDVDLDTSNTEVQLIINNAEATIEIQKEIIDASTGIIRVETEPVEKIILPSSWSSRLDFPKWDRLCWEQQRAAYRGSPWWFDIFELKIDTPTPGWFEGEFDFPIEGYQYDDVPTEVFPLRVSNEAYRMINADVSNRTIEGAQSIYRDYSIFNFQGSGDSRGGAINYWTNWREMDREDEPVNWVFEGKFDFSSWGVIDEKQVPLIPNRSYDQPVKTFDIEFPTSRKPIFIPYWSGNDLKLYYYDTIHSETKRLRVLKDNKVIINETFLFSSVGTIDLGTFDTQNELKFIVQFWHRDKKDAYSWIEEHVVKTTRPMVADTVIELLNVSDLQASDDTGGKYFKLTFSGVSVQKMYKAPSVEKSFVVDMSEGSHWRDNLINQSLVGRIVVSKLSRGIELPLGSFLFNPIGSGSSTDGSGLNIQYVHNENGVFGYFKEDNTDGNYTIRFYPNQGDLINNRPINSDYPETYEFRIAEWTLACEHGLRTGENFAYMDTNSTTGARFRYDSWDEEHPVRRWLRMSPVDPQFDSEERLAELAKSRECTKIETQGGYGSPSTTVEVTSLRVFDKIGWKAIYAESVLDNLYGTWHSFEFKFKLGLHDNNASKIELHATYLYPRIMQHQPPEKNPKEDTLLARQRAEKEERAKEAREKARGVSRNTNGASASIPNYADQYYVEWTDIGNTSGTQIDPETGTAQGVSGIDSDGDGAPDQVGERTTPLKTQILSWSHSTDELHVVDFVSYQKVFFLVWNWLNSLYNLSNFMTDPDEPEERSTQTQQVMQGMGIPYNPPPLPADVFYLSPENALQFQENCLLAAEFVDNWIRSYVRIKYVATIHFADGSTKDVELTNLDSWGDPNPVGQLMDFDMPTVPDDNFTFVTSGVEKATDVLRGYTIVGDGDGDGTEGSDNPGGLKPAGTTKKLDLNGVDPGAIDMSEKQEAME